MKVAKIPRKWIGAKQNIEFAADIAAHFEIHPMVARVLAGRFETMEGIEEFLHVNRDHLYHPMLMHDMEKAVKRIRKAIQHVERVLIVGDYDVDGVTATTILVRTLESLNTNVSWYIPSRFTDGYGLHPGIVHRAHENGVSLIITVDNGIASFDAVAKAKELGIDLIITDHHHIGQDVPVAHAVVHPAYPRSMYPFKELCGAGVAFKLAQALLGRLPEEYLDLVALGTVADQVPLVRENRVLVKEGLALINRGQMVKGLSALVEVAGLSRQRITSTEVAFRLAPRINAVGRLADASLAVELLLADDPQKAAELARTLHHYNERRKSIQEEIEQQALGQIEANPSWLNSRGLVVAGDDWHEGVIGIVAGHLTEWFYRPTLCISVHKEQAKGSGRSVDDFDLYQTLDHVQQAAEVFSKWGGHAAAAGFSLPGEKIPLLRETMQQVMDGYEDVKEELTPKIMADAQLELGELSYQLIDDLKRLEPFGEGNSEPIFFIKNSKVSAVSTMGSTKHHLRVMVSENNRIGRTYPLIAFGEGENATQWKQTSTVHLLATLNENVWEGQRSIQLMLVDARFT